MTLRRLYYFCAFLLWAGAVFLLFKTEKAQPSLIIPPEKPGSYSHINDSVSFLKHYRQNDLFGYSILSRNPDRHNKELLKLREKGYFRLVTKNGGENIGNMVTLFADKAYSLKRIEYSYIAKDMQLHYEGEFRENQLDITLKINRKTQKRTIKYNARPELMETFIPKLVREGHFLTPSVYSVLFLDPLTLTIEDVVLKIGEKERIEVSGEKMEAVEVVVNSHGLENSYWYTPSGLPLRRQSFFGYQSYREHQEEVMAVEWPTLPYVKIVEEDFFVVSASGVEAIKDFVDPGLFQFDVAGIKPPTLDYQRVEGAVVTLALPPKEQWESYNIPLMDEKFKKQLLFSAFAGRDVKLIRETTLKVLAGERDARRAIDLIQEFSRNFKPYEPLLVAPPGLSYNSRAWTDKSHRAVIVSAMLQSIGIPTLITTGVTYKDAVFRYDTWLSVYLGRYLPFDPGGDVFPASLNRVALKLGPLEYISGLMEDLSKTSIKVQEVRP